MVELSPSRSANLLGIAAIASLILAVGVIWDAGGKAAQRYGPTAIATTPTDEVYFQFNGRILHTDGAGNLRGESTLEALGIAADTPDMAVDGDTLYLIDAQGKSIKACDWPTRRCRHLARLPAGPDHWAMDLSLDKAAGLIYTAISAAHRVDVFNWEGEHQYRMDLELRYPNDIFVLGDQRLLIADTNHHRVLSTEDLGDGQSRSLWEQPARTDESRPRRRWPTAVGRADDGRWWVINSDNRLKDGDVVVFGPERNVLRRVMLPEKADPFTLAAQQHRMLITDMKGFAIYSVSLDGTDIRPFGDQQIQTRLSRLQQEHDYWNRAAYLGWALLGLGVLLAMGAAALDWKARREATHQRGIDQVLHPEQMLIDRSAFAPAQGSLKADAGGYVWLEPHGAFLRQLRLLLGVTSALTIAALIPIIFLSDTLPWHLFSLLLLMIAVLMGLLWFLLNGLKKMRIGTNGQLICLRDFLGRRHCVTPAAIIVTHRRLIAGRIAVGLGTPKMTIFNEADYAAYIEPLLSQAQHVSEAKLLWEKLKQGDRATWLGMIALFALLALQLWFL